MILTAVVVKAFFVREDGRVLLVKRSDTDDRRPGEWDCPGGGQDQDENYTEAIKRETLEEIGLDVAARNFTLVYAMANVREGENIVRLCYVINQKTYGDIKLSLEHSDYTWVEPDEAVKMLGSSKWADALDYVIQNNLLKG